MTNWSRLVKTTKILVCPNPRCNFFNVYLRLKRAGELSESKCYRRPRIYATPYRSQVRCWLLRSEQGIRWRRDRHGEAEGVDHRILDETQQQKLLLYDPIP
ncbi:hypothetical protein EVAR_53172_1 [Eumeta japonica]|uniref:Uncharacterized protein n=1 Tax=Eumeta variegata TaxID=151549 RepID=A0A4C1YYK6_EUMVA|nr:hypothetical protein EVAR_53172_1 [Eumeta japonica]